MRKRLVNAIDRGNSHANQAGTRRDKVVRLVRGRHSDVEIVLDGCVVWRCIRGNRVGVLVTVVVVDVGAGGASAGVDCGVTA